MNVAIIGCGGIARSHAKAFQGNGVHISALVDSNLSNAQAMGEEFGVSKILVDFTEALDDDNIQAISICHPPVSHEEIAVYALKKGLHVLCEKPMSFDIEAAHRIRQAAAESTAVFMPAFRHRFLPGVIELKNVVDTGLIGDVVMFNNVFSGPAFDMEGKWFTNKSIAGGGCLLDTSTHSVDVFRFIVGEIEEQKALMHRHFKTTDVEDAGMLIVKSKKGALGLLASSFAAGSGAAYIDITGTARQSHF